MYGLLQRLDTYLTATNFHAKNFCKVKIRKPFYYLLIMVPKRKLGVLPSPLATGTLTELSSQNLNVECGS